MHADSAPPDETPDRVRRLVSQVAAASLMPILWYATRRAFSEGYFEALGLPSDLGLTPPISLTTSVAMLVGGVAAGLGLGKVAVTPWFGENEPVRYLLSKTVALIVASMGAGFLLGLLTPSGGNYWVFLMVVCAFAYLAPAWVRPLFTTGEGTFSQKVARARAEAEERRARPPRMAMPGQVAFRRVLRLLGPGTVYSVFAIVLAIVLGQHAGLLTASKRTTWVAVDHSFLHAREMPAADLWILLSMNDGRLWVAPVKDGAITRRAVAIDPAGATLWPVENRSFKITATLPKRGS